MEYECPLLWALFWPPGPVGSSLVPHPTPHPGALLSPPVSPPPSQKLFVVPADEAQARIPYSRVNHNKYMVTERATYIGECPGHCWGGWTGVQAPPRALTLWTPRPLGTSNWSGSYFTETAGTSLLVTQNGRGGLRSQLEAVFLRDWDSPYSHDLDTPADSVGNACRLL